MGLLKKWFSKDKNQPKDEDVRQVQNETQETTDEPSYEEDEQELAKQNGYEEIFNLYRTVEKIAPQAIASERKMYKGVCANVDFYSGLVYDMLGIPEELYTPIFAISRIAGWGAHRIEELVNSGKVIRPAYKSVAHRREYVSMQNR